MTDADVREDRGIAGSANALVCLAGLAAVLFLPGVARAAAPVSPSNVRISVTLDRYAPARIASPGTITFTVSLDGSEARTDPSLAASPSAAHVWVSTSPTPNSEGLPSGEIVASCLIGPLPSQASRASCAASTALMAPNTRYYWWLSWPRFDGSTTSTDTTAPASFTVTVPKAAAQAATSSGRDIRTISTLPSASRFTGQQSIKQTVLSELVYRTIERLGLPRLLNVACWDSHDWHNVTAETGTTSGEGEGDVLLGFFLPRMPRWIDLSPKTCTDLQGLIDTGQPNGRRAGALTTLIHEAVHAHGVSNEAETNCLAVQLVPYFAADLDFDPAHVKTLSRLALHYVRTYAPRGYWDYSRCRDGGVWDLDRTTANLGI